MGASKNGNLDILRVKCKAPYKRSYKTKNFKTEAFAKCKKKQKKNNKNQICYQKSKARFQDLRKQFYLEQIKMIPKKSIL